MIHYRNAVRGSGVDGRALVATAKRLLAAAGKPASSLSLTLVGDEEIRTLNRTHRAKDKPTDVLSFSLLEGAGDAAPAGQAPEDLLGDVVISVDTARRQAREYGATLQRELYRLLIHGLLHVLGHDHEGAAERRTMQAQERRLARAIDLPWPYEGAR
jgi:probable rRNA maturation factor